MNFIFMLTLVQKCREFGNFFRAIATAPILSSRLRAMRHFFSLCKWRKKWRKTDVVLENIL